jgi:hypothetical protein
VFQEYLIRILNLHAVFFTNEAQLVLEKSLQPKSEQIMPFQITFSGLFLISNSKKAQNQSKSIFFKILG